MKRTALSLLALLVSSTAVAEEPNRIVQAQPAARDTAQPAGRDTAQPAARTDLPMLDGMVRLNFPAEVEVKALVDYVSQRLSVKIIYDEQIANKKVCIKGPGEIPVSSLLGLLESALKMKGMALEDAEAEGWKRIVTTAKLRSSPATKRTPRPPSTSMGRRRR